MEKLVTEACYILFGSNPFFVVFVYFLAILFIKFVAGRMKNKDYFLFLISISPSIIFAIRLLLNDYFLSDDFEHFVFVSNNSYLDIIKDALSPEGIWGFHRLFTAFWLFKFIYSIFGASYEIFVLVCLLFHILNAYLLSLLIKKLLNSSVYLRYLLVFVFSSFYLTWISNIHELLAGFFFLSTFLLLLNRKFKYLSILTYILGIYSKEIVFILPICYSMFLITYNNYIKKIDIKKRILEIKPLFLIFIFYLFIFVKDFLRFSSFSEGSGYDTVYKISNFTSHLSFYVGERIPTLSGLTGLMLFLLVIVVFDFTRRKLILTPLFLSFLGLIFPVLFLSKSTAYYLYVPFIFIVLIIAILLSKFRNVNSLLSTFLASVFVVFVLKLNLETQQNCFLIQYPRIHPMKKAVHDIINNNENNSEEAKWVKDNNYVKYFKK